ncbi:MAG TPA: thioredoxin family protein, partial [candidate division Zixibacteria bacterium]|nr:thioredoxin family protein [candidate division Zixibacteria bacterium]
ILVNFTTSWCGFCKKMNRTTFKEADVINALNNDFVSIKVNCESNLELDIDGYKITERNLARAEYGVRGYPTYWFLKSDTRRIAPLSGYQGSDRLLDILFYIKNELYDKMKYNEYLEKGGRKGKF